jgi:hypothetical protein
MSSASAGARAACQHDGVAALLRDQPGLVTKSAIACDYGHGGSPFPRRIFWPKFRAPGWAFWHS